MKTNLNKLFVFEPNCSYFNIIQKIKKKIIFNFFKV